MSVIVIRVRSSTQETMIPFLKDKGKRTLQRIRAKGKRINRTPGLPFVDLRLGFGVSRDANEDSFQLPGFSFNGS